MYLRRALYGSRTVYRILENLSMSRKLMSHELRIRAHTYFIIAYCVATAQVLLGVYLADTRAHTWGGFG